MNVFNSRLGTAGLVHRKRDKWKRQNWCTERKIQGNTVRDKSSTQSKSNCCINGGSWGEKRENVAVDIVEEIMLKIFHIDKRHQCRFKICWTSNMYLSHPAGNQRQREKLKSSQIRQVHYF